MIPRDLLDGQTIESDVLPPQAYRAVDARIAGDPQAIQRAVTLLAQAQRPLLLVGGGVIDADASKQPVALAEFLDMALVPSYGHSDAIPNSHHLYIGRPGGRGSGEAAEVEGRRGAGCNVSLEFHDPDGYMIELTCEMEQIGWNQSARPHNMHRPAKSLEDAAANPV